MQVKKSSIGQMAATVCNKHALKIQFAFLFPLQALSLPLDIPLWLQYAQSKDIKTCTLKVIIVLL